MPMMCEELQGDGTRTVSKARVEAYDRSRFARCSVWQVPRGSSDSGVMCPQCDRQPTSAQIQNAQLHTCGSALRPSRASRAFGASGPAAWLTAVPRTAARCRLRASPSWHPCRGPPPCCCCPASAHREAPLSRSRLQLGAQHQGCKLQICAKLAAVVGI
jgi:hypothetical protein